MDNYKNNREDNNLFPYEYGVSRYEDMLEAIFSLLRKERSPNIDFVDKHMSNDINWSFNRKFRVLLSQYMNYSLRRRGIYAERLKNDEKLRQLLEPLAKILCTEKSIFEEWLKKNPNGYGEYSYPDGSKYVGEFNDGQINGQGSYTYHDGSKYVGELEKGKYHGQGILSSNDRLIYEGEWKNGKRHGQGTDMSKDDKHGYKGEWKDDKYHGQGINIVQNKNFINDKGEWQEVKLEGEWKNGEQHGQGSQKGKDWEAVGEFKDGKRWNVTSFDNDRNIGTQVVNGVQQIITK